MRGWFSVGAVVLLGLFVQPVYAQVAFGRGIDTAAVVLAPELRGAVASLEAGNPLAAILELRNITRRDESHVQALKLLASAHLRMADYAQTADVCRKIVALDSSDAGVQVALGYAYQQMGDMTRAEAHYTQALLYNRDLIPAYQGLGWIYLKAARLEAALRMVSETTERAPNYALNYILMGRVLTAQGFFEDAAVAYNKAFSLQSNLRDRYGILLQELGLRHRMGR